MLLNVSHPFLPKTNTTRAAIVMDHFGIGFEQGEHVIADGLQLPIQPGAIVLFTGPSGSGKSSLMRAAQAQLGEPSGAHTVVNIDSLDLGERLLIDSLPLPVERAMSLLAACGLGEAQLMLRTPQELSDGQRYRFRLALALSRQPQWIIADEFTATLDRTLAKVISFNLHRLGRQTGTGFLLATTHEDVTGDLHPDLHVRCRLDGAVSFESAGGETGPKKKSRSSTSCGSPLRPNATGRTSLGGITAATTSG